MILRRQSHFLLNISLLVLILARYEDSFADVAGVAFSTPETSANELTGQVSLTLQRTGATTYAFSVDYSLVGDNGFPPTTNTVQFAESENTKSISIGFPDNTVPDGDRDVQLQLQNPSDGAVLADPSSAVIHIIDNDGAGGVDPSFAAAYQRRPFGVVKQSTGSVIVVADNTFRVNRTRLTQLTRFAPDGTLDSSFATPEFFYTRNVLIDSADRIIFISQQESELPRPPAILGRLMSDGSPDPDFHFQTNTLSRRQTLSMLLLPDDSVILGKSTSEGDFLNGTNVLERFSATGEKVPFASGLLLNFGFADPFLGGGLGGITALAREADGSLIVAGTIDNANGQTVPRLLKLDDAGNLDTTFAPAIGLRSATDIRSMLVLGDGGILLGGVFRLPGATRNCHLVRLAPSGELDPLFTPVVVEQKRGIGLTDPEIWQILPDSSGSLFIRGPFDLISGEIHLAIARVTAAGVLDSSFRFDRYERGDASIVRSMVLDEVRGLTVAGTFSGVDFVPRTNLVRVLAQGRANNLKAPQTITFAPISDQVYTTNPVPLSATASSGLPVRFKVISGSAVMDTQGLLPTGSGPIVIQADQSGDNSYDPAPPVTRVFTVSKASQNVDFKPVIGFRYLDPLYQLIALASSGLPVSFEVVSGPARLWLPNSKQLFAFGAGIAQVRAVQDGDDRYEPAFAEQTVEIGKASQTITLYTPLEIPLELGTVRLDAITTAKLPLTYELLSGPATIEGPNVQLNAAGTMVVRVTQSGSADFEPASPIERAIVISPNPQSIDFPPLPDSTFGGPAVSLSGTASSGLPVTYSIGLGSASLSGNQLSATTAGTISVIATQPGDASYAAAAPVSRTWFVAKSPQTITFTPPSVWRADVRLQLSANASSGLAIQLSMVQGDAVLSNSVIIASTPGLIVLEASQNGDGNYLAASTVQQVIQIVAAAPQIALGAAGVPLLLQWPKAYDTFILQESASPGQGWTNSTFPIDTSDELFSVSPELTEPAKFFRLQFHPATL